MQLTHSSSCNVSREAERFLEGLSFEIIKDDKVLKHFFTNPKLSRREARWIETLDNFEIFPITLRLGKINILTDAVSRVLHAK